MDREEYWVIMIDKVWNTAEWKARSRAGRQNRNTLHDGVVLKHTGGSISITQHRMRIEKEKGHPPTASEVFERTHLKKGSTSREASGSETQEFVTPRAQQVLDAYQEAMVQKYGPDVDAHPFGDTELWEQCVGGRRKGRLFGFGVPMVPDFVQTSTPGTSSTGRSYTHYTGSASADEVRNLKEQMQQMQDREEALRRQIEEQTKLAEDQRIANEQAAKALEEALRKEMHDRIVAFEMIMLTRFQPPPPPPPMS